jgi:hypothetical protein
LTWRRQSGDRLAFPRLSRAFPAEGIAVPWILSKVEDLPSQKFPDVDGAADARSLQRLSGKLGVAPEGRRKVAPGESSSPGRGRVVSSGISPGGAEEDSPG